MKKLISIVNGVEISAVFENGETCVPVKPICEAIGIDAEGQRQRIMRHYILGSVAFTLKATGADGKAYEMLCLPLEFIYGWLFTIDSNIVAETRRDSVWLYQQECFKTLYTHFTAIRREKEASARKRLDPNDDLPF